MEILSVESVKKFGHEGEDKGTCPTGDGCSLQGKLRWATLTCLTVHWNDVVESEKLEFYG